MSAIGRLFDGPPAVPKPPAPTPMPDLADPALLAAKRREALTRQGAASTLLSGQDDYTRDRLGTA
jgi:hypothetical protein